MNDDIMIIYDENVTDINKVFNKFNEINPKLKFKMERESNNKLNFLDLTLHRNNKNIEASIYRKPTATSTMIHKKSCHPLEQKMSGVNYLLNRIITYPISKQNKCMEINTCQQMILENGYTKLNLTKKKQYIENKIRKSKLIREQTNPENKKWAKFTYIGIETKVITQGLKKYNIYPAFNTTNTLSQHLGKCHKNDININKADKCGVYKLPCGECPAFYIGQTGRNFGTRFKEHINDIRFNREKTGYSHHILNTGHQRAKNTDTMEFLEIRQKGQYLNTLERFHIYQNRLNNILNENMPDKNNPIFDMI
jgi:hypothetical protein